MRYTVYDNQGNTRLVSCPANAIKKQLRQGESFIEGTINPHEQKVIDGKITPLTDQEKASMFPGENIPAEDQPVFVKKKEWDSILDRLTRLEGSG